MSKDLQKVMEKCRLKVQVMVPLVLYHTCISGISAAVCFTGNEVAATWRYCFCGISGMSTEMYMHRHVGFHYLELGFTVVPHFCVTKFCKLAPAIVSQQKQYLWSNGF